MAQANMTTSPNIRHKALMALMFCFIFAVNAAFAVENQSIAELRHKAFRVTTTNEKQTMALITGYSGEPWDQEWWGKDYDKPCINNVANLNRTEAATIIKGTSILLAFLDCPAASDAGLPSIVSMFDATNTNTPMCFSRFDLKGKPGYYYWGRVESIEVRMLSGNDFFVAPAFSGGDGGDSWMGYAFLHMDSKCNVKLLSTFYASSHDADDPNHCVSENLAYRFVSGSTIEIKRKKTLCTKTGKQTVRVITKRLDLNDLLHKPIARVFEP